MHDIFTDNSKDSLGLQPLGPKNKTPQQKSSRPCHFDVVPEPCHSECQQKHGKIWRLLTKNQFHSAKRVSFLATHAKSEYNFGCAGNTDLKAALHITESQMIKCLGLDCPCSICIPISRNLPHLNPALTPHLLDAKLQSLKKGNQERIVCMVGSISINRIKINLSLKITQKNK